ncbi:MAG: hypothetical protein H0U73_01825 [Tatlockia sp.]|nr:hypothetical protein [Tatlockia sp.]
MKNNKFWQRLVLAMLLGLNSFFVYAAITPKFLIFPIARPQALISANGMTSATYLIVNNTERSRILTMVPQNGVIQATNLGNCASAFFLLPGHSCLLYLNIYGALISGGGVHSGPIICKTMSNTDGRPDPFLCSAVNPADRLDVSITSN